MPITLYHDVPSTNCDRVKIVLAEKGLAWEGIWVKLGKMEQKSPEHLKRNPYGKIPVIDDDGKLLFESCIINEYLDEKYPNPPLQPKDPYLRARGRILIDYFLNYLHEPYWALRGEMIKKNEAERDQKVIVETRKEVATRLQYLEDALGDKPYLLGRLQSHRHRHVAAFSPSGTIRCVAKRGAAETNGLVRAHETTAIGTSNPVDFSVLIGEFT